nr:hypothetical protein [Streptomyces sp. S1D4-11]QIY99437.1 hypothetical protein HEP87_42920 [Streptomyces sp. S1D4-11]
MILAKEKVRVVLAGSAWETRVLLSPTNPESQLTILRSSPPTPLAAEEFQGLEDPAALTVPFDTDGPTAGLWKQLAKMGQGQSPTVLESAAVAMVLWAAATNGE